MKSLILIATLFTLTQVAYSQTQPCTLKSADLPEIRGLKLGMKVAEIKSKFPRFRLPKVDEEGKLSTFPEKDEGIDLEGAFYLRLTFVESQLTRIVVTYDGSVVWAGITEFASAVAESLNLPNAWQMNSRWPNARQIECDGFVVMVNYLGNGGGGMLDVADNSRTLTEEKRRKKFKP
jgi:hypothetical protein